MADVKERPILFSAPMARAILDGRKTQTRRVMKPQQLKVTLPRMIHGDWPIGHRTIAQPRVYPATMNQYGAVSLKLGESLLGLKPDEFEWLSPYGKPGDRLWVRETWQTGSKLDKFNATQIAAKCLDAGYPKPGAPILYTADGSVTIWGDNDRGDFGDWGRKRSSRFMPRWASRITLEMTEVRVERLLAISEEDAVAEGIEQVSTTPVGNQVWMDYADPASGKGFLSSGYSYATLWESINGEGAWDANPWVWALTFRRVA